MCKGDAGVDKLVICGGGEAGEVSRSVRIGDEGFGGGSLWDVATDAK